MQKIIISTKLKPFFYFISFVYIIVLIKFIFFKYPTHEIWQLISRNTEYFIPPINLTPFKTIINYLSGDPTPRIAFKNLIGNIILFLPFGFLVPCLKQFFFSFKNILLSVISFSLLLEILQLLSHLGSFDIDDIILNSLGGIIGYILFKKLFIVK